MITAYVLHPFVHPAAPGGRYHIGDRLDLTAEQWRQWARFLETPQEREQRLAELARIEAEREALAALEREQEERVERGLAEIYARAEAEADAARAEAAALCAEEEWQRLAALVEVEFLTATFLHTPGISGSERVTVGDRRHVTPETFAHLAARGFARATSRHEERLREHKEAERAAARAELERYASIGDEAARRALEALEVST